MRLAQVLASLLVAAVILAAGGAAACAAQDAPGRAQALHDEGRMLLAKKSLQEAIAKFEEALAAWPEFEAARGCLTEARRQRDEAVSLTEKGSEALAAGRWDDAIALGEKAFDIFPLNKPTQRLLWDARVKAAEAHTAAGAGRLAEGRLDEADDQYQKALRYLDSHVPARQGLALTDAARGRGAESAGLWGAAVLHYLNAADHSPDPLLLDALRRARLNVLARVAFRLALDVRGQPQARLALAEILAADLARRAPGIVRFLPGGPHPEAEFLAVADVADLRIQSRIVGTDYHKKSYVVSRQVDNPAIPRLQDLLASAIRDYNRCRDDMRRPCPDCDGKGSVPCRRCHGSGTVTCDKCRGKGQVTCDACDGKGKVDGKTCSRCKGRGRVDCEACGGRGRVRCPDCGKGGERPGWVRCETCQGTGKGGRISDRELRDRQRDVADLQQRLAREPAVVVMNFQEEWPYSITRHEKVGRAEVRLAIQRTADRREVASDVLHQDARYADSTVDNPNPQAGVPADPLTLPDDDRVATDLVRAVGPQAATRIIAAVLKARADEARAAGDRFARAGDLLRATEAYVDGALLTEAVDPAEAADILRRLRRPAAPATP